MYITIFDLFSILNYFVYFVEEQGACMVLCFAADWAAAVDSAATEDYRRQRAETDSEPATAGFVRSAYSADSASIPAEEIAEPDCFAYSNLAALACFADTSAADTAGNFPCSDSFADNRDSDYRTEPEDKEHSAASFRCRASAAGE